MPRYERELRRGALMNAVGLAARLLEPLFILIATRLYGSSVIGDYLVAISLVEIAAGFIATGYCDAVTIFASRDVDRAKDDPAAAGRVAQVLANGFAVTLGLAIAMALATQLFAGALVDSLFAQHRGLVAGLPLVGWSLVPFAFTQVALAATKAHMRMEYDALFGGLRPVVLVATATAARWFDASVTGLLGAWLVAHSLLGLLAVWPVARLFDLRAVAGALARFRPHGEMLWFALPQSLNLTLNRYITRLDVLILASFAVDPVHLAWYGTAALLTSNLKTIRTVFSGALAPVAARHHQSGEREALIALLGRLSRLTTTLIVPIVLAAIVLRDDVLGLVDAAYRGDSRFVVLLLALPFVNCAYGLAGNCLMFTGHSGWTLANSVAVAVLNTVLNLLLIPSLGLFGAALATLIAVGLISAAQIVELRVLERVPLRWRDVAGPHLGLAAAMTLLAVLWDPAALPGLPTRVGVALLAVAVALGVTAAVNRRLYRRPAALAETAANVENL